MRATTVRFGDDLWDLLEAEASAQGISAAQFVRDATKLLDSPAEESFDRITKLAARVLNAPVALISLVDEDRQFFKSSVGLDEPWHSARETPLSHSFCRHTLHTREPLVWTRDQIDTLEALGAAVLSEMELAVGRQAA
jgi:GAF domain-containing protein